MIYDSKEFWEEFEESAAILEFDAGYSNDEAEKLAFKQLIKKCEESPD